MMLDVMVGDFPQDLDLTITIKSPTTHSFHHDPLQQNGLNVISSFLYKSSRVDRFRNMHG